MGKTIWQVDAFTTEPFKGNPAGVMLSGGSMPAETMQNIATEMNLSETAFVIPAGDGFRIRFFTPAKEMPLCGHATLSSAHIMYELGLKAPHETIFLKAKAGDLIVEKRGEWLAMNFPAYPAKRIDTPAGFKEIVGFEPVETWQSSGEWIVAFAGSRAEIERARPDFGKMAGAGLGHLSITAGSDPREADFVVRCFAPLFGIDEDPVTGSAHCALIPLWSEKLGKQEMDSLQISKRGGRLKVRMAGNGRVEIMGKAVTVFEAKLKI